MPLSAGRESPLPGVRPLPLPRRVEEREEEAFSFSFSSLTRSSAILSKTDCSSGIVGLGAPPTVPSKAMSTNTPDYGVIKGKAYLRYSDSS